MRSFLVVADGEALSGGLWEIWDKDTAIMSKGTSMNVWVVIDW